MHLIPRRTLHDIEHLFDHTLLPFREEGGRFGTLAPKVDLREKDDAFEISIELPGVKTEDVTITLSNGILSVEADSKQMNAEKTDKIIRQERHYGRYVRNFELGPLVQDSDISAQFDNGVLTLTAPKHKATPPSTRRIQID